MFHQNEPMSPPSVYCSPSEEPKADKPTQNQTISKRLRVAQILVRQDQESGIYRGVPEEDLLDSTLDYLDDCAETLGEIEPELNAIIASDEADRRRAA